MTLYQVGTVAWVCLWDSTFKQSFNQSNSDLFTDCTILHCILAIKHSMLRTASLQNKTKKKERANEKDRFTLSVVHVRIKLGADVYNKLARTQRSPRLSSWRHFLMKTGSILWLCSYTQCSHVVLQWRICIRHCSCGINRNEMTGDKTLVKSKNYLDIKYKSQLTCKAAKKLAPEINLSVFLPKGLVVYILDQNDLPDDSVVTIVSTIPLHRRCS